MSAMHKLYKNVFASLLPQIVNIISSLILPILIIEIYGSQINGLVSTIRNIISYISLVGAGVSVAVVQSLYAPVAQKDEKIVKGMLCATANMFNRCGWLYLGIVTIVSLFYPFAINDDISYITVALLLVVMSISGASEFFMVGKCRALLYADQKVYVCTTIQAVSLFLSLILAVIMLRLKTNIVFVQLAISMVYIVRAFLLSYYVKHCYPQYRLSKDIRPIQTAVANRKYAMVHQLSGLFVFSSQSIILSTIVNLEAASIYAVYNIVFSGLGAICGNINTAITPFLGRTMAISNIEKVREQFDVVELAYFCLTVIIFSVTLVTIVPFISIYTHDADINYIYPLFAVIFTISQFFNVFRQPHSAIINVAGHFKETQTRALVESIICICCSLIFTKIYGMYGVLIGTSIAFIWRCLDMIIYIHRYILNDKINKSLCRLIRVLLVLLLIYIISPEPINVMGYMDWCIYTVKVFVITLITLLFVLAIFEYNSFKQIIYYIRK